MPEGDTIFRSAAVLKRALAGRVITRFGTALVQLASARMVGRRIDDVAAAGKHLLMTFDGDLVLRTHMRMSGSWHLYRPGERWQRAPSMARITIGTDAFDAVAFGVHDAEFVRPRDLARTVTGHLGPDLLDERFDVRDAVKRMRARADEPLATALLDQRIVAGIGNVFKSEVLFLAGLHPDTSVRSLTDEALGAVLDLARKVLAANVAEGGAAGVRTERRTTGRVAPDESLFVYGRTGRRCRHCGTPIEWRRERVSARSTYWCPACQRLPQLT